MSTTREQILAALTEATDGLTSKEIATDCPACECDPQVVGRTVSMLRGENLIHSDGLRSGDSIWFLGPRTEDKAEQRIPLHERPAGYRPGDQHNISQASRDIAAMRGGKVTGSGTTVAERVVATLTKHGRLSTADLATKANTTPNTLNTMGGTLVKLHGVLRDHGFWDLQGTKKASTPAATAAPKPAAPAATAPAPAHKGNGTQPDGLYDSALVALRERRGEVSDARAELDAEIGKLDTAIEALQALAA